MPLAVDTPVFDAGSIALFKADGVLEINSATEAISGIKVFDSRGRLVLEQSHLFANTVKLPQLTVSRQVLFVRVTSGDGNVVTKKVVY
ncbi:T9SS sorting signal type C domain-containing protein [Flavobacterium pallidum]